MEVSFFFVVLSFLMMLSGFLFIYRIPKCKINNEIEAYPTISIIIPARNEEHNIGKLLDSINLQDFGPIELIVVNDNSTDKTAEIVIAKGATLLNSKPLPAGWLGKPWACFQGAEFSNGQVLIFLDSDIEIEKDGLGKMIDSYLSLSNNSLKKIALSIAPFHKVKEIYEEFSALFNVIMTGSMNAFTPFSKAKPTGLFGPSLIIARENYFAIDGHRSVKDKKLENMFMAEKFVDNGVELHCLGGAGTLSFRMYSSGFKDLVDGWSKAFADGAGQLPIGILLNIIAWISSGIMIFIFLINGIIADQFIAYWLSLYVLFALQLLRMLKMIGTFRLASAALFPVLILFFVVVFSRSLIYKSLGKSIKWKSRDV